jgi:ADP-ribosyl-[dinitrogen reductase] hydrolase
MWEPELLGRWIEAAPAATGAILVLPAPTGSPDVHARQLAAVGAAVLVSLVEPGEAARLGLDLGRLARACAAHGTAFRHAPIADLAVPGADFEAAWADLGPRLAGELRHGRRLAIHCRAGLGRSGTVAARLLIELGLDPEQAVARVRVARPGAIETPAQERHLRALRPGHA